MLSLEEFIDGIYSAMAPVVADKASDSEDALAGYRDYLEKRYSKTYGKMSDKVNKLVSDASAKIVAAEMDHLANMEPVADGIATPSEDGRRDPIADESRPRQEPPAGSPVSHQIRQFDGAADPDPDHGQNMEVAEDSLKDAFAAAVSGVEVPIIEPAMPAPAEMDPEGFDELNFGANSVDTDAIVENIPFVPPVDTDPDGISAFVGLEPDAAEPVSESDNQSIADDGQFGGGAPFTDDSDIDDDLIDDDEISDTELAAGNNDSIPDLALYGIDSESIADRKADSAMNRLIDASNKVFREACAVVDGMPPHDNELAYIQASDELYAISGAVDEENEDTAKTLVMETALDLMTVYGKGSARSVRVQLYANRKLPIEERKAQVATRIAADTAKSLTVSFKGADVPDEIELQAAIDRYSQAKVAEVFKRVDESNLDVLDDIRRMMMDKEPARFAGKPVAKSIAYMDGYAARHGL